MLSDAIREDLQKLKSPQHSQSGIDTTIISDAPIVNVALSYKRVAANIVVFIFLATTTILTGAIIILGIVALLNFILSLSQWMIALLVIVAILAAIGAVFGMSDQNHYDPTV